MSSARPIYVVALMGMSPAVVTELLWHLRTRERRTISGGEVWTTAHLSMPSGARSFETLRALHQRLVASVDGVPALEDHLLEPMSGASRGPIAALALRDANGRPVHDITDSEVAEAVAAQLHDRIRDLVAELDDVDIVGSLTGGRKTMSAALQTAFTFQARATDRLVHVLLDPRVEAAVDRTFAFPSEVCVGLNPDDQLSIHEVAFPRMRHWRGEANLLGDIAFRDVCRLLAAGSRLSARLVPRAETSWLLDIQVDDRPALSLPLGPTAGRLYRSLVRAEGRVVMSTALAKGPFAFEDGTVDAVDRALQRLRGDLFLAWPLAPVREGGGWRVEAAARVEVDDRVETTSPRDRRRRIDK